MYYIAKHYVTVNGQMYTPGEVIPGKQLTKEKTERLLRLGAIRKPDAPFPVHVEESEDTPVNNKEPELLQGEEAQEPEDAEEEEEPAPEIDVMDGIVAADAVPEEPAPRRARKKKEGT